MKMTSVTLSPRDDPSNARWKLFPNTTTVAAYYPTEQVIELSKIGPLEFAAALSKNDPRARLSVVPTLAHETQHWLDHTGTLWGQKRLVSAFRALEAQQSGDVASLWRIADYYRLLKNDHLASYYSTITQPQAPDGKQRWRHQLTCGFRFDACGKLDPGSPILFTRFQWQDGSDACRVPFSASSLLECAAVDTELTAQALCIAQLGEPDRTIDKQLVGASKIVDLYTPSLAVYSVAAHACANRLGLSDAATAYRVAGALAYVCLNMPDLMFATIRKPSEFDEWGNRTDALVANHDIGYAFLALLYNGPQRLSNSVAEWLDSAISSSGIPPFDDLLTISLEEMRSLRSDRIAGSLGARLDWLLDVGTSHLSPRKPRLTAIDVLSDPESHHLPPIILGDTQLVNIGKDAHWTNSNIVESWWSFCSQQRTKWTEFLDACS